jgi:hypothetical protein
MSFDITDASKKLRCPVKIATRWQSERRWNDPVPGRELHPLKSSAFHGVLIRQSTRYEFSLFSFVVIVVVRGALLIVGGSGGGPINVASVASSHS